jgi:ketosteroid isomerase-like protein
MVPCYLLHTLGKLMINKTITTALVFLFLSFYGTVAMTSNEKNKMSDAQSAVTLKTAEAFLAAAGSGDMATLKKLMTDDFAWHNEGDSSVPWIGSWEGKEAALNDFMPKFGAGLKTTSWTTDYSFANGNQAVFMGKMSATANNTGVDTGKFSWAVRVHVENEKVKSWNWFEDSYAVSKAYHAKK